MVNNLRVLALTLVFQLPIAADAWPTCSAAGSAVAGFFRFIYFIPGLVGAATMALMWGFIYSRQGLLNGVLNAVGLRRLMQHWLSADGVVQWAVAVPGVYAGVGFFVIIYMAAISEIPEAL